MFKKPIHNRLAAILAGVSVFLAFEKFAIVPVILLFPSFLLSFIENAKSKASAFRLGLLTSFTIMCGGFYWVIYVIHEFGYLPWSIATLLFLAFSVIGALNFPVFSLAAFTLQAKSRKSQVIWYTFTLPCLFTIIEFFIPKLFPWYLGHSLYRQLWLIQAIEWTGSSLLTFTLFSLGSAFYAYFKHNKTRNLFIIPSLLILFQISFSLYRLNFFENDGRLLKVGLIQANIGNIEKVTAENGSRGKVRYVVDEHISLTESLLQQSPDLHLILWPETAMPFQLNSLSEMPNFVRGKVSQWGVPLISGGYSQSKRHAWRDHNSAFFILPQKGADPFIDLYHKNILLAFGEYLPLQDFFPKLAKQFPQIGGFDVGLEQNAFVLPDGTRLGVTICYEAILPEFYRKSLRHGIHAMVNLTNDSWFGPTAEPYLHGSLTVFRAIESRVPLYRVTNTGTSFGVDSLGRMSVQTPVYEKAAFIYETRLPQTTPITLYTRLGDWFILLLMVLFVGINFPLWKKP